MNNITREQTYCEQKCGSCRECGYYIRGLQNKCKELQDYFDGYDQCLNDIKEFLYGRFYIHPHDCHVVQYVSDKPLDSMDDLIEEFKKLNNEL